MTDIFSVGEDYVPRRSGTMVPMIRFDRNGNPIKNNPSPEEIQQRKEKHKASEEKGKKDLTDYYEKLIRNDLGQIDALRGKLNRRERTCLRDALRDNDFVVVMATGKKYEVPPGFQYPQEPPPTWYHRDGDYVPYAPWMAFAPDGRFLFWF